MTAFWSSIRHWARIRHYGGFVLGGVAALATDAVVLTVLTRSAGMDALIARIFAIAAAMVVSWLINRTITFQMTTAPSLREFARFAAVVWTAQAVNYGVFAAILLSVPQTAPLTALVLASLVAMFVSYAGYRFGVFRQAAVPDDARRRPNGEGR